MGFHLAQIIAELGQGVGFRREAECGSDGFMDLGCAPTAELRSAMKQHLHEPPHTGVLNLHARDFGAAGGDRQSQALEQREIDRDVEQFRFQANQAVGRREQLLA